MSAAETVRSIVRERDLVSHAEFDDMLEDFRLMIAGGEDPEEALQEVFGLEPDYIFDSEIVGAMEAGLAGPRGEAA